MGSGFEGANDLCFDTSRLQSQPQGSNPSLQASIPALRLQSQLQGSKPHFPSTRLKIQCSHQSYPISYNSIQNCFLHALTNYFTKRLSALEASKVMTILTIPSYDNSTSRYVHLSIGWSPFYFFGGF